MEPDTTTTRTCPLYQQTGTEAVIAFDTIIASLPPALRSAFEAERIARQQELEAILREHGYHT